MICSNKRRPEVVHSAGANAALFTGNTRARSGPKSLADERWRHNNRALRAGRSLSAGDRRELRRTFAAALLGLTMIAAAAVAWAAFMPTAPGQLVSFDEAGTELDRSSVAMNESCDLSPSSPSPSGAARRHENGR